MQKNDDNLLKKIVSHAKEYGFVFPSSEIYDGLSSTYDYGQNGVELKNNIKSYWWKAMVQMNENIVGLDTAIFMHPSIWKTSGHIDAFNDPLIDNKDSKKRYRADVLIEEYIAKIELKIDKEITKAAKRFGVDFNKEEFITTNAKVGNYKEKISIIRTRMQVAIDNQDFKDLKDLIEELGIVCPASGSRNWTNIRQFNLMFSTELGALSGDESTIYLRPETAQGIFVNYLNVQKSARMKLPFGVAQIGKAFRNEIIARQFIFRMREFEQMEMQFFVKPGEELDWYERWKNKRMNWHKALGLGSHNYRFQNHLNLAHYANAATDIEYNFPMGFKELEGIHSRTNFDLAAHQKASGKKMSFFDPKENKTYIPYVIETSIGLDRMFLAVLTAAYNEEKLDDGSERTVLNIPPALAPIKVAVLPLTKKDNLPQKARALIKELKFYFSTQYDEKDAIGKRYRRQDAIGTPYCITVDHKTLEDNMVTIRDRDTMKQIRLPIEEIRSTLEKNTSMNTLLQEN